MTSLTEAFNREYYQGFTEFKNAVGHLQEHDRHDHRLHRPRDTTGSSASEDDCTPMNELLSIAAVHELEQLCAVDREERDLERCAELCSPLSFFKRLTTRQNEELFRKADLIHVPAGSYVERIGDPVGYVYVVILGCIVVEQEMPDIGNRKAFVHTIVDGKVFGDGWSAHDKDGVRHASTIAQEESLVLRISTPDQQAAMRVELHSQDSEVRSIKTHQLSFLEGVGEHELSMLAMMTEIQTGIYGDCILYPGNRPNALFVLARGVCSSRVAGHTGAVETFQQGACFGHGALLNSEGICSYSSNVSVVVDSVDAEFHLLNRKALEMLPDVVRERIQEALQAEALRDPIRQDIKNIIKQDLAWLREKKEIFAEFYRASSDRCLALSPLTLKLDDAIKVASRLSKHPTSKTRGRKVH